MKTHWKKLHNPDYLGSYSLMIDENTPGTMVVQIESVQKKNVTGLDGKSDECIVMGLVGTKPMILNPTNAKMMEKLTGSPMVEDWCGKRITLTAKKIKAFGEWTWALRIADKLPEKERMTPDHKGWAAATVAVRSGANTIEQIRTKYELSDEDAGRLKGE